MSVQGWFRFGDRKASLKENRPSQPTPAIAEERLQTQPLTQFQAVVQLLKQTLGQEAIADLKQMLGRSR